MKPTKPLQRFIFLTFCSLLAVAFIISCEDDSETGGSFAGYVFDSSTILPIDSAMISVRDTSGVDVYSDSTGKFIGASFGTVVKLFVRKEGYVTQLMMIDLRDNRNDLEFNLVPITK